MDPAYAAAYRNLYENHWWWRARETYLLARLDECDAVGEADRRILDIGCGDGLFFDELARYGKVWGLEPDSAIVSNGPRRSRIHVGLLDETFRPESPFDWILALDVLEHVEDARAFLDRTEALLAKGGRFWLTVPAFPFLWTRHDELNHHFRRYTKRSLEEALAEAGLEPVEMHYFFHWLAPLKLAVRLKESVVSGPAEVETVPPRQLNRLARKASVLEQRLFSRLRLPFGSSLFALCRRSA